MTFSEALEQYLDARDKLAALARDRVNMYRGPLCCDDRAVREERENAIAALTEAAERMNELMPCEGVRT